MTVWRIDNPPLKLHKQANCRSQIFNYLHWNFQNLTVLAFLYMECTSSSGNLWGLSRGRNAYKRLCKQLYRRGPNHSERLFLSQRCEDEWWNWRGSAVPSPHPTARSIFVVLPSWGSWIPLHGRSLIWGSQACLCTVKGKRGDGLQASFRVLLSSHCVQECLELHRVASTCHCSTGGWGKRIESMRPATQWDPVKDKQKCIYWISTSY